VRRSGKGEVDDGTSEVPGVVTWAVIIFVVMISHLDTIDGFAGALRR
jgi:hypothetical protein